MVPYSDSGYYSSRPTIAIPRPDENGGALRLDSQFGLHPALSVMMPFWANRSLAFIHASALPIRVDPILMLKTTWKLLRRG